MPILGYVPGDAYGYEKKLKVAAVYHQAMQQHLPASVASIACKRSVSQLFVDRILVELNSFDRVLCPSDVVPEKRDTKLGGFAAMVVLRLYMEELSPLGHGFN